MRELVIVSFAVMTTLLVAAGTHARAEEAFPEASQNPPVEASFPHEGLKDLETRVANLEQGTRTKPWLIRRLSWHLELARYALRRASAEDSVAHIERFAAWTGWAVKRRFVPQKPGLALRSAADRVHGELQALITISPNALPHLFCVEDQSCNPVPLHVAQGAKTPEADGSSAAPFASIKRALEHAQSEDIECVELLVQPGVYQEGAIAIDRDTHITGVDRRSVFVSASITNDGNHTLALEDLTLVNSPSPGAVIVDAPCARTRLESVVIWSAQGYGVWQRGGTVEIGHVRVSRTQANRSDPDSGRAFFLLGNAWACMHDMNLGRNEGGALLLQGAGTSAHAAGLQASDHQVNPARLAQHFSAPAAAFDGLGTVEVRDNATLAGELMSLSGNQFIGLFAHHGGQIHCRYSSVRNTASVTRDRVTLGGMNAAALLNGQLELTGFSLNGADVCGLLVAQASARAQDGTIARNAIGACLHTGASEPACIADGVAYEDNGINLDNAGGPIPPPEPAFPGVDGFDGGTPESPRACTEVPFAHPWCE